MSSSLLKAEKREVKKQRQKNRRPSLAAQAKALEATGYMVKRKKK